MENNTDARKKALRLLECMDRSEHDLTQKLLDKGFSAEQARDAVEYAKSFGYVNDLRYAEMYIDYNRSRKSRKRIEYELKNRGVDDSLISAAFESFGPYSDDALIDRMIGKKKVSLAPSDPKSVEKLKAYLSRQGFSLSEISEGLRRSGLT